VLHRHEGVGIQALTQHDCLINYTIARIQLVARRQTR